jgi:hypothetical protein
MIVAINLGRLCRCAILAPLNPNKLCGIDIRQIPAVSGPGSFL